MQFHKIKDGQGDYHSYDTDLLYQELTNLLGSADGRWQLLNTDAGEKISFDVIALDPDVDLSGVSALVQAHGGASSVLERAKAAKKRAVNTAVVAKIREQYDQNEEFKMLRLQLFQLGGGETAVYNVYIEGLRSTGQAIKDLIDQCESLAEVEQVAIEI
jgi:hypothetical protein